jgi:hypothetical protein
MAYATPETKAYREIGKEAAQFAKMIVDFERFGSGEFLKHYPDYDYDGTDYVCHRARMLADALNAYALVAESGMAREARAKVQA